MSSLAPAGEPPVTRCALCTRDAAGPCARCKRSVCGDCCELTEGGATTFAICLTCVRRGGTSLRGAWTSTLGWLAIVIVIIAGVGLLLMLANR
jgi:hypothetical protein